jgi:kynurenine formamidase
MAIWHTGCGVGRAAALAALALGLACASAGPERERLVDLTHPFDAETIYWPTEEGFVLEREKTGVTDAGYYYEAHRFRAAEHGGTHIDAPIHFYAERWTVDQIPLDRLIGDAVVIDVEAACASDRDHAIDVADLAAFEAVHGEIPRGAIVLLRTGFGRRWPDRRAYLGTERRGPEAVAELRFPGLSSQAARWLIEQRAIAAVGLDTPSIDPGVSTRFETHQVLFEANVPAFENLANLERLPATGSRVIALPMKIGGGSGAPLRAVAIVPGSAGDAR